MLIAGRIIGGFAVGMMSAYTSLFIANLIPGICIDMVIPIYNSEIAPPRWVRGPHTEKASSSHTNISKRGLVSGLHAQFVGFGFAAANVRAVLPSSAFSVLTSVIVDRLWVLLFLRSISMEIPSRSPCVTPSRSFS